MNGKIIDKTSSKNGSSAVNRAKFIKRYKESIKRSVEQIAKDRELKEVFKSGTGRISGKELSTPNYRYGNKGKWKKVAPGNNRYNKKDKIYIHKGNKGKGKGATNEGDAEDDFYFTLTKEEFIDLYFSDLKLPNYVKEGIKNSSKFKWRRAGKTKHGIPAKLNLMETMKQAISRRIATKATIAQKISELEAANKTPRVSQEIEQLKQKKPRYFDKEDMRYNLYKKTPEPVLSAVMFCLMDVSASMGEYEKMLAKKFFLLLYLFLEREYKSVELVFVRHTHRAEEVTEEEFFYGKVSGGTVVSEGLKKINTIIDERYDLETTNIYVAQASDGDNWPVDNEYVCKEMENNLLDKVQYFAYVEISDEEVLFGNTLYNDYELLAKHYEHFNLARIHTAEQIYKVLHNLFEEKK